jgi:hypothetical protein
MRIRLHFLSLLPLATLIGCSLPYTPAPQTITGNWQIQAGSAITSPPNTYPSFLGAIQVQGTQATGIFTTVESAGTTGQPVEYSGAFDSSTEDVSLATFGSRFDFTPPATPHTIVPVGVTGGCVYPPTYTGPECLAIFMVPSVGVEIAPLNGTYSGSLTGTLNSDSQTTPISGTATLVLTQSSTPNASGQFPLTGTITFPSSSGMSPVTLPGLISGTPIWLNNELCVPPFSEYAPCTLASPTGSNLNAYTNPTATQITVTNLINFTPSGNGGETSVSLTGILTLQ